MKPNDDFDFKSLYQDFGIDAEVELAKILQVEFDKEIMKGINILAQNSIDKINNRSYIEKKIDGFDY